MMHGAGLEQQAAAERKPTMFKMSANTHPITGGESEHLAGSGLSHGEQHDGMPSPSSRKRTSISSSQDYMGEVSGGNNTPATLACMMGPNQHDQQQLLLTGRHALSCPGAEQVIGVSSLLFKLQEDWRLGEL